MAHLYEKIWRDHLVCEQDGVAIIYIDRHLVHEVTSPQAFHGLRLAGRGVSRPSATLAVPDHNVPTTAGRTQRIENPESALQLDTLAANVAEFGIPYISMSDIRQGIVHVVGPEQGFTLPGTTIVCGDSHTSTHGAFGALAFGIGSSEVEHVLATQTLTLKPSKAMRITVEGALPHGVTAKDLALAIIGTIGTGGATGHVVEFAGSTISGLSMEGRMTVCNMAIEAGARSGLIAPDQVTFDWLKGRPLVPEGASWDDAMIYWKTLFSDGDAVFDQEISIDASLIEPLVTWGTSPEDVLPITAAVPDPAAERDPGRRAAMERSLTYMALRPGTPLQEIAIDRIFIGSCTNSRIEDLRAAAEILRGRKIAPTVSAMVVPGSGLVKRQAEQEGLKAVFVEAGFEWREPGCSMCLAMNPDKVEPGERCVSTSNRNFEGRQGPGGRTHLVSPAMAAAAAVAGHLTDVRTLS